MKMLQRLLMGLGVTLLITVSVQLVAPKAVHAVVSTLVTVANTAANPVVTQASDNHARTGVALQCSGIGSQEGACSFSTAKLGAGTFQVPAGQRFVIDQVSGTVAVPPGSSVSQLLVTGSYAGPSTSFFPFVYMNFVPTQIGSDARQVYYNFSTPMTGYIDPDYTLTGICSLANPTAQGQISCSFNLFGHLETIS